MNNPKDALLACQKAVELDPNNADGWNQLATLLRRTGELAQAEDACRKALALSEAHPNKEGQAAALRNLGIVHKKRGELDKAEEMHQKALALYEEASVCKEGMGLNYVYLSFVYADRRRGDFAQAEAALKKSLSLLQETGHPFAKTVQQWVKDVAWCRANQHGRGDS